MSTTGRMVCSVLVLISSLAGVAAQTAGQPPRFYALRKDSTYESGCFAPCACPILIQGPVRGGFRLTWGVVILYLAGAFVFAEPGVARAVAGPRLFLMFGLLGPMVEFASLLVSVIVSSRASDPRSAQQLGGLLILPLTAVFVAQLTGVVLIGPAALVVTSLGLAVLNALLIWVGVKVFQRESILTRWR